MTQCLWTFDFQNYNLLGINSLSFKVVLIKLFFLIL